MSAVVPDQLSTEETCHFTWFAPPHRASDEELSSQIAFIAANPVISGVLTAVGGLIAVLNENRQILAINDGFFTSLGLTKPSEFLGVRLGEALHCVHAADNSAGCGTGRFCSTCGAAVAITATLATNQTVERTCALSVASGAVARDFSFLVKASPLTIDGRRFLLLFLHDRSAEERRCALEKSFLHDVGNTVMGLDFTVNLLALKAPKESRKLHDRLRRLTDTLVREVKLQRLLVNNTPEDRGVVTQTISTPEVIRELRELMATQPAARGLQLNIAEPKQTVLLTTDLLLLLRVLLNMLLNACEATENGGEVRCWIEAGEDVVIFSVWNQAIIPPAVAGRIFQRFFSTKEGPGRGFGTFSMKLVAEQMLGGTIDFTSSLQDGTLFTLTLPR